MKPCNPNKIEGVKSSYERREFERGYDLGIKEMNHVANKIKAEIIQTSRIYGPEYKDVFEVVVQIIDKHIAESEE